jgi:5-methylcytosine-specific restriction enzyme A
MRNKGSYRTNRQRALVRDGYTCRACGGRLCGNSNLTVDHVIPLAKGGTNDLDNLQTLGQRPCHEAKTRRDQTL